MIATLKHVANQYILIVDERPKIEDWCYYDGEMLKMLETGTIIKDEYDYYCTFKIIAAENLEGVKGIKFKDKEYILNNIPKHVRFKDDETTWKEYLEQYIDTEVEVTENEDYWVVRL